MLRLLSRTPCRFRRFGKPNRTSGVDPRMVLRTAVRARESLLRVTEGAIAKADISRSTPAAHIMHKLRSSAALRLPENVRAAATHSNNVEVAAALAASVVGVLPGNGVLHPITDASSTPSIASLSHRIAVIFVPHIGLAHGVRSALSVTGGTNVRIATSSSTQPTSPSEEAGQVAPVVEPDATCSEAADAIAISFPRPRVSSLAHGVVKCPCGQTLSSVASVAMHTVSARHVAWVRENPSLARFGSAVALRAQFPSVSRVSTPRFAVSARKLRRPQEAYHARHLRVAEAQLAGVDVDVLRQRRARRALPAGAEHPTGSGSGSRRGIRSTRRTTKRPTVTSSVKGGGGGGGKAMARHGTLVRLRRKSVGVVLWRYLRRALRDRGGRGVGGRGTRVPHSEVTGGRGSCAASGPAADAGATASAVCTPAALLAEERAVDKPLGYSAVGLRCGRYGSDAEEGEALTTALVEEVVSCVCGSDVSSGVANSVLKLHAAGWGVVVLASTLPSRVVLESLRRAAAATHSPGLLVEAAVGGAAAARSALRGVLEMMQDVSVEDDSVLLRRCGVVGGVSRPRLEGGVGGDSGGWWHPIVAAVVQSCGGTMRVASPPRVTLGAEECGLFATSKDCTVPNGDRRAAGIDASGGDGAACGGDAPVGVALRSYGSVCDIIWGRAEGLRERSALVGALRGFGRSGATAPVYLPEGDSGRAGDAVGGADGQGNGGNGGNVIDETASLATGHPSVSLQSGGGGDDADGRSVERPPTAADIAAAATAAAATAAIIENRAVNQLLRATYVSAEVTAQMLSRSVGGFARQLGGAGRGGLPAPSVQPSGNAAPSLRDTSRYGSDVSGGDGVGNGGGGSECIDPVTAAAEVASRSSFALWELLHPFASSSLGSGGHGVGGLRDSEARAGDAADPSHSHNLPQDSSEALVLSCLSATAAASHTVRVSCRTAPGGEPVLRRVCVLDDALSLSTGMGFELLATVCSAASTTAARLEEGGGGRVGQTASSWRPATVAAFFEERCGASKRLPAIHAVTPPVRVESSGKSRGKGQRVVKQHADALSITRRRAEMLRKSRVTLRRRRR